MKPDPMFPVEIARRLGHSVEWFHDHYDALVLVDGMPPSLATLGRKRFDRAMMEAWLNPQTRKHVARPANDPIETKADIAEQRAAFAAEYGKT